jgi:hypothetical protein
LRLGGRRSEFSYPNLATSHLCSLEQVIQFPWTLQVQYPSMSPLLASGLPFRCLSLILPSVLMADSLVVFSLESHVFLLVHHMSEFLGITADASHGPPLPTGYCCSVYIEGIDYNSPLLPRNLPACRVLSACTEKARHVRS